MALQTSFTFRFADIEVNEPELRVTRSGEPLAVEPKAFHVLIHLLHHAGHLVSKEELFTAVWGDIAVTDSSLTRAIALLRRLLDDDPRNPRYIETVSTAGYRFICPVECESPEAIVSSTGAAGPTKPATVEPRRNEQRSREAHWIALVATGVALIGGAGLIWYVLRPLPSLHIASYTRITSVGQRALVAGTDGSSLYLNLYLPNGIGVVPASGGRVVPLSFDLPTSKDSPNNSPAIWNVSPDGTHLLVASNFDPSSGRKFWIVDTHGGGARYLAQGYAANWSSDGRTVVYSTVHGELYNIPTDGGEPILLLASPAAPGTSFPVWGFAWSPKGNSIRFLRNRRYWEISADGTNLHEVLPSWHASSPKYFMGRGHWTPDGEFFLFRAGLAEFSQNLAAGSQIWALDERRSRWRGSSPDPVQLTTGPIVWGEFVLSMDGKTIYCTGMTPKGELDRYDAKSKQLVPYLGGISAESVRFSRDGKYLAYVTYPEGTMWRANRDGRGLQQLTGPPFYPTDLKWSPDGTQILFFELSQSHRGEMYTISSQGGMPKRLLPNDKVWNIVPDWSPDGKKIVFDQTPAGTGLSVFQAKSRILDIETGKVTDLPLSPKPCDSPQWSPDGRYILEMATDHKAVMLLDLRTSRWLELNPELGAIDFLRWSHDGRSIYFEDTDLAGVLRSTEPGIYRIPVTGGRAEKIVDMKGFRGAGPLGVGWSGLDPDDTPLLLRDVSTYDVYALSLERK